MNNTIMKNYGYYHFFDKKLNINNVGRIIFSSNENYRVICSKGELNGVLKGNYTYLTEISDGYPYVGDWVTFNYANDNLVVITDVFPRKNKISRKMRGKQFAEQIIACNIDYIIICISANENFSLPRLERYLYAFSNENAKIVIVITKKDLIDNIEEHIIKIKEKYSTIDVIATSIFDIKSLEEIKQYLKVETTSVIIGSSGVGKSTLINQIAGKEVLQTGEINEKTHKGKHTTTFRKLIYLGSDLGCIIDTPGMRSISLWNCDVGGETFKDIEELILECKYRNCTHTNEIGCAILDAIKNGYLSKDRYQNFLKLKNEENFLNSKTDTKTIRDYYRIVKQRERLRKPKKHGL